MLTRRQRAAKAETLVKLPVEILLSVVGNVYAEDDLLALSQVNKALREVTATVLFKKLYVDVDLETYPDLLCARTKDPWVRPAVRELHIDSWARKGPPKTTEGLLAVIGPLVEALRSMTGLVKVNIAAWMMTGVVFVAICDNPSIRHVSIIGPIREMHLAPEPPTRPRDHPLSFDLDIDDVISTKAPSLLDYISRGPKCQVKRLSVHLDKGDTPPPGFLFDAQLLPVVEKLRLDIPPLNAQVAASWLNLVPTHLPTLGSMIVSVSPFANSEGVAPPTETDLEPFFLTADTWLSGQEGIKQAVLDDLFVEWSQMPLMGCEFARDVKENALEGVALTLDFGASVQPAMIRSLAQVLLGVTRLDLRGESFADSPEMADWPGTVSAFAGFTSLKTLSLSMSTTPKPTMEVVVGCKPECVDIAEGLLPSLKPDMALLGGNFGLWTLGVDLNLRRIELLGPYLPVGAQVCWIITDAAEAETSVNFAGFIKAPAEEGKRTTLVMEEVQEEMEWQSGQRCTVCHKDMITETPVELVMACPVEEVRASMARTKPDWAEWDKSEPSSSPTDFERWLRRM